MTFVKVIVRLALLLGFCLTAIAVGVGHFVATAVERPTQPVGQARTQYLGINDFSTNPGGGCRMIDSDTGRIVSLTLPGNDKLLFARSSPWEDESGRLQVVGRWLAHNDDPVFGGMREVGLVRCTFPGGEVIDRVALDVVPASAPCWFPGTEARILFGGTDGRLYQVAFDDREPGESDDASERQLHPDPIAWACDAPGNGEVRISDPTWPTDPRLRGRLVATLTYIDGHGEDSIFVPSQIWWLELSDDGQAIKAAGQLTVHRRGTVPAVPERLPSLATTPDGGLALAYLTRPAGQVGWELRLGSVTVDEAGRPRSRPRTSVCLARDVEATPPIFSPDGGWVVAVRSPSRQDAQAERFSVAGALPARDTRQLASHHDPARVVIHRLHRIDVPRPTRTDRTPSKS